MQLKLKLKFSNRTNWSDDCVCIFLAPDMTFDEVKTFDTHACVSVAPPGNISEEQRIIITVKRPNTDLFNTGIRQPNYEKHPPCWTSSNPHSWMTAAVTVNVWAEMLMSCNFELPEIHTTDVISLNFLLDHSKRVHLYGMNS